MPGSESVGVAVIGAGRAGMIHARNFASGSISGARLTAIAEPVDGPRRKARRELQIARAYSDYRQVLGDAATDAVVVATPSAYHGDVVVAAAQAGKHVLCEKPMAMHAAECDAMLAAVEQAA